MTDETNKDENQNDGQAEPTAEGAGAQPDADNQPQAEAPDTDDSLTESSEDSTAEPVETMASVMDMYEESFKRFAEGEVVTGRIISIDKDHVLIDIGYKSEGQVRIDEFLDEKGEVTAQIGDSIEVMVE